MQTRIVRKAFTYGWIKREYATHVYSVLSFLLCHYSFIAIEVAWGLLERLMGRGQLGNLSHFVAKCVLCEWSRNYFLFLTFICPIKKLNHIDLKRANRWNKYGIPCRANRYTARARERGRETKDYTVHSYTQFYAYTVAMNKFIFNCITTVKSTKGKSTFHTHEHRRSLICHIFSWLELTTIFV